MKDNFKLYSQYYDLLYQDKDYPAEAAYIIKLIKKYQPTAKNILELGAGTGIHANLLATQGYTVHGLERSPEMVAIANQNKAENVSFEVTDISNFNCNKKFDVAISLFHVISYLTANTSLIKTFKNVNANLKSNGVFIFDVWHSPAVHAQGAVNRTKTLKNQELEITRKATPTIYAEQNIVEVNYEISIKNLKNNSTNTLTESHPMRHFSKPEIELLAYATGFDLIHSEEFLTAQKPSEKTWGVCYVLRKK
jgi:SAM-dependent methyltransferase